MNDGKDWMGSNRMGKNIGVTLMVFRVIDFFFVYSYVSMLKLVDKLFLGNSSVKLCGFKSHCLQRILYIYIEYILKGVFSSGT